MKNEKKPGSPPRRRLVRVALWALWALLALPGGLVVALGIYLGFFFSFPRISLLPVIPAAQLDFPLSMVEVPDGSRRVLVAEKAGLVKVFSLTGRPRARTVLDLRDRVSPEYWEDGLLSLAFHPQFPSKPFLFLCYTGVKPNRVVVSRFRVGMPDLAMDAAGEEVLLSVIKPKPGHNGGSLAFGPEGYLFVSVGESRVHREARNRQNLLGTILRLDVDRAAGGKPYAVPPDNPFVDASDGIRPEIWAYGFRNPWRISIDRENGRLYVGDVGAHKFEEITRVKKGGNHGWPTLEGIRCFDPPVNCKREGLEMPLAAFPHDFLRTVIGGYVYRGSDLPFLKGRYVFADFFRGLYSLSPEAEGIAHTAKTLVFRARGSGRGDDAEPKTGLLVRFYRELLTSLYGGGGNELRISSLAEDSRGELYVLGIYGGIYRLAKLN